MATTKTFKKNEVIFREGDNEDFMYDIWSGKVGIYSEYKTPAQKLLVTLESEDVFGEMGMIEQLPRSATAVALEDTQARVISYENFKEFISEKPAKAYTILQHTSSRLRDLSLDYVEACAVIAEYVKAEKNGEKPSAELMAKLKKIDGARKKNK